MAQPELSFTRRRFLKGSFIGVGFGVGIVASSTLCVRHFWSSGSKRPLLGLERLSQSEARTLLALFLTILGPSFQGDIKSLILFVDGFTKNLPNKSFWELRGAFFLMEHLVPLLQGHISRFSELGEIKQIEVLHSLENGQPLLRPLFKGLKELCYFAYYVSPASWSAIGYAGPQVTQNVAPVPDPYVRLIAPRVS